MTVLPARPQALMGPFLLALCLTLSARAAAAAGPAKGHVLVLNSYAPGYHWVDGEVEGIEKVLRQDPNLFLHIEYMDTKLVNTPEHFRLLRDLYAGKYRSRTFDLILATDDDALRFLRQYRRELFPGVPVVFCGINYFTPAKVTGFDNYTGVNERSDFKATLDLLLRLRPGTRTLYVVNDRLTTGRLLRQAFVADTRALQERLRFVYLDDLTLDQLQRRVAALPADSAVFYLSFFRDAAGHSLVPRQVIPTLARVSPVPIYGTVDYMLGLGIVGGKLRSGYHQGVTAARLAKRVLAGEPARSIPVVMESPNEYMFDYHQLARFGIPLSALPADRIIINEPRTFYYRYKHIIWTTLGLFVLMGAYILVLLLNIRKRIRAQRGLRTIIAQGATLMDRPAEAFGEALAEALARLLPGSQPPLMLHPVTAENGLRLLSAEGVEPADLPETARPLLERAFAERRCLVDGPRAAAWFGRSPLSGTLAYLEGEGRFDDLDRDLLEIFASNLSMALEGLEKHKMDEALETARKIQMSMLPRDFQGFSKRFGLDLHAFLEPAKEVGGDLYDFFAIDGRHLCFTVGDVSDKGIPAALFMVMAKTLVHAMAERIHDPAEILRRANEGLARDNGESMFVTQFLAILDLGAGELHFANAGHNPPYRVSAEGRVTSLHPKAGMVLGAFPGMDYQPESLTLAPGDTLVIYSDGVTEAKNPAHGMFGESRLEASLAASAGQAAEARVARLIQDLRAFTAGAPQSDDITVLMVRYRPDTTA